jgi:hypothetical protein
MRTSFDVPDALFRHLKAQAAVEGTTLRELLLRLIERGMASEASPAPAATALPSVRLGAPMAVRRSRLSNAGLNELLDA